MKHTAITTNKNLASTDFLNSIGIEIDTYPADAFFSVNGDEYIGTYSKDRETVCIMMADNLEKGNIHFTSLSKDIIKEIAYTCTKLITDFGCEVHSHTMKTVKPFNTLEIVKASTLAVPAPISKEVEPNYYACQLDKVKVGMTEYSPTIKVFANGNGEDTKHMSLNDESAKVLIQWLKNNFPNCED